MVKQVDLSTKSAVRTFYRSETQIAQPAEAYTHSRRVVRPQNDGPDFLREGTELRPITTETGGRVGKYVVLEATGADDTEAPLAQVRSIEDVEPVYHTSDPSVPFIPTGVILLDFAPSTSAAAKDALLARYRLEHIRTRDDGSLDVRVPKGVDAVEVAKLIEAEPDVELAEPAFESLIDYRGFELPSEQILVRQWHYRNLGEGKHGPLLGLAKDADARIVAAWSRLEKFGTPEVVIGVIDDGFDLRHPDLNSARILNPWPLDAAGQPDIRPRSPAHSHGTRCSGVAIGRKGRVVGCAPACSWIPVRQGEFKDEEIHDWFDHMLKNGAWVISCSWGSKSREYHLPEGVSRKIHECATLGRNGKGCVILFAVGNNNEDINAPSKGSVDGFAIHPDVIAVSASTSLDKRALKSNFGKEVWICAPTGDSGHGADVPMVSDITTTDLAGKYYEHFLGTSSACALVAGICGLILTANPNLTACQVKTVLKGSARRIDEPNGQYDASGHSIFYGYGCVDADKAVKLALNFPVPVG